MTRLGMALDTVTCIGCLACTLACKVENGSPAGIWLAPVIDKEIGHFPQVRRLSIPTLCIHCAEPPCLDACPTGAISRRDDGIVLIDPDACCGSRACVIACPYGAIHFNRRARGPDTPFEIAKVRLHQPGTAHKCTFCVDRVDRGLEPACVVACPTGARIFGDREDPDSPLSRVLKDRPSTPIGAPIETSPSVSYLSDGAYLAGATEADIALPHRRQGQWGWVHALEWWLLGAGAGIFHAHHWLAPAGTILDLDRGPLLAFLLVAAAGGVLLLELGRPFRFPRAVINWRTSWISRGAIADLVFLALAALLALPLALPGAVETAAIAGAMALAILVAAYPGLALGTMRSVRAWRGPWPALEFLVESSLSGVALVGFLSTWSEPVLTSLAALALLRLAMAAGRRRAVPIAAGTAMIGAGLAGGLAILALVLPSATALAGSAAGLAALIVGLAAKLATLGAGSSPSPFGAGGELGGSVHAED